MYSVYISTGSTELYSVEASIYTILQFTVKWNYLQQTSICFVKYCDANK